MKTFESTTSNCRTYSRPRLHKRLRRTPQRKLFFRGWVDTSGPVWNWFSPKLCSRLPMPRPSCGLILAVALPLLSCGGNSPRLQSLTISPVSGSGSVQYKATGTMTGSSQSMPVSVLWWTNQPWTYPPTPAFWPSISSAGLAQCKPGAPSGARYTIWAVAPLYSNVPLPQMNESTEQISATAQLTCP